MKKILLIALIMISVANAKVVSKDPIQIDSNHWEPYTCAGDCTFVVPEHLWYAFETHDKSIFYAKKTDTIQAPAGTKVWFKVAIYIQNKNFSISVAEVE